MLVKQTGALLLAALMLSAAFWLQGKSSAIYRKILAEDERYYLPSAKWVRFFCLGANEAAADLVWIKTLIYFGGQTLKGWKNGETEDLFTAKYMLTAAELDPHFYSVYKRGAALTMLQHGKVTRESLKTSIKLIERGLEHFPDDGDLMFDLGFFHYYEMRPFLPKDPDHPKRKFHRERGVRLIRQAALLGGGPPMAPLLASTLLKREGMDELVVEHLKSQLAVETDETVRFHLIEQLRQAAGEQAKRDIQQSNELLREWKDEMPYISYDLYSVLRSEVSLEEVKDPLYFTNRILGIHEGDDDNDDSGDGEEVPAFSGGIQR